MIKLNLEIRHMLLRILHINIFIYILYIDIYNYNQIPFAEIEPCNSHKKSA